MVERFEIGKDVKDGIALISVTGAVDAHTAPEFERAIEEEVLAGRVRLVVDCRDLSYISSAGLGVFMGFIEDVREAGGDIKICGLTRKVRRIFEALEFDSYYDIQEDAEAAMQRFAEPARGEA